MSRPVIESKLRKSRAPGLCKAAEMLKEHQDDLGTFLTQDEKGRQLPAFLEKLADAIVGEQKEVTSELEAMARNVEHIKQIVSTQQNFASAGAVTELVSLAEVAEDAIRINLASIDRHQIKLERLYGDVPQLTIDRHKVLQILVNLISNAKWAVSE